MDPAEPDQRRAGPLAVRVASLHSQDNVLCLSLCVRGAGDAYFKCDRMLFVSVRSLKGESK